MKSRRPAYTLIEMIAVMSLTAIVITLCVTTIAGLLKADRSSKREWAETAALERLARSFRRDVHASAPPGRLDAPDRLELRGHEGGAAEYRIVEGGVAVRRPGEAGGPPRQETFRARSWVAESFALEGEANRQVVSLIVRPTRLRDGAVLPIEAVAGSGRSGGDSR